MTTKVYYKSYLPGHYSMRDLNENSSSSGLSVFYGDNSGQCYNGFMSWNLTHGCRGYEKDALKQKILEHEEVFKNQVYELHRLYGIQRNMMEEVKSKRLSVQPSSSSSLQGSQMPWHIAGLPFLKSGYGRASNSPTSCSKGNYTQTGLFPYQNGSTSKDSDALDSRPFKLRKKLFDLQLPSDQYIDNTEEENKLQKQKVFDVLSYIPNGNSNSKPESTVKLRNSIALADLNEPVQIEEAMGPTQSSVCFLGHMSSNGEIKCMNQPAISNAGDLGVTGDTTYAHDGFLKKSSIGSEVNGRGHLTAMFEADYSYGHDYGTLLSGSTKSNLSFLPQHLQQDKLHVCSNTAGCSRDEPWRERINPDLQFSGRSCDYSNNNGHLEPVSASQAPFFSSSCFAAHSVSSWPKPSSSFSQKITTFKSSLNFQLSRLNQDSGNEKTNLNGFYHGSALGSKERLVHLSPAGIERFNCSRIDDVAHESRNYQKGSFHPDSKPLIDLNLNEAVILQYLNITDEKHTPENCSSALPWLNSKPAHGNQAEANSRRSELLGDLNQPFTPTATSDSSDCEIVTRNKIKGSQSVQKNLEFPIFETGPLKHEQSYRDEGKKIIDINLECGSDEQIISEELAIEKEYPKESACIKNYIDLNECVSESEDPSVPSCESKSTCVKISFEIDLEAPVLLESEDDNINTLDQTQDEVLRNAAEIMVAMSSSCPKIQQDDSIFLPEASLAASLPQFVDIVSLYANELDNASGNEHGSRKKYFFKEMDDFEVMTLQIKETKEGDYMHVPFVPDIPKEEETRANTVPTRTRRGQARRGRQRRNFQRDILPGMVSLSRHEVTEDLQIFGGLMKAMGHSWSPGLARRNGIRNRGGRFRRQTVVENVPTTIPTIICTPLMQQVNMIEVGLEDRSLTGWGKTTRCPRRQRCPTTGNILAIVSA